MWDGGFLCFSTIIQLTCSKTANLVSKNGRRTPLADYPTPGPLAIRSAEEFFDHSLLIANLPVALDDLTISHGLVGVVDFIQGEGLGEDLPRVDLTIQDGL